MDFNEKVPAADRIEFLFLAADSHSQLHHTDEAIALYQKAIYEVIPQQAALDKFNYLTHYKNFYSLLEGSKKIEEGVKLQKAIASITEQKFGNNHEGLIEIYHFIAQLLASINIHEEAIIYLKKALSLT